MVSSPHHNSLLPDLLDESLQVILDLAHMGQEAGGRLVTLSAHNFVTVRPESVVQQFLGASAGLGVELGLVGGGILTLWHVEENSKSNV